MWAIEVVFVTDPFHPNYAKPKAVKLSNGESGIKITAPLPVGYEVNTYEFGGKMLKEMEPEDRVYDTEQYAWVPCVREVVLKPNDRFVCVISPIKQKPVDESGKVKDA